MKKLSFFHTPFYYICNESSVLQPKTRANFTTSMSRYVTMEPTGSL